MKLLQRYFLNSLFLMTLAALGCCAYVFLSPFSSENARRDLAAAGSVVVSPAQNQPEVKKEKKSWLARLALKIPRYRDTDHLAAVAEDKATIDKIYNPAFVQKMESQYKSMVGGAEKIAHSPFRRATPRDHEVYDEQRRAFTDWLAREIISDQVKQIFSNADRDSAGIKVVNGIRSVTGGEEVGKRTVVSSNATTAQSASTVGAPKEEAKIPTKLRTKLNLIRSAGSLQFSNPVVSTNLNVDLKKTEDRGEVDMNKDIKAITLNSQAKYAVDTQKISLQLNKKITDGLDCSVATERYTGNHSATNGDKSAQKLMMNYSIGF